MKEAAVYIFLLMLCGAAVGTGGVWAFKASPLIFADLRAAKNRSRRRWTNARELHPNGTIRQSNGAFAAGFDLDLPHTTLEDDEVLDRLVDDVIRAASRLPNDSIVQFRYDHGRDPAREIAVIGNRIGMAGVFEPAVLPVRAELQFLRAVADGGGFCNAKQTVWVYVPAGDPEDKKHSGIKGIRRLLPHTSPSAWPEVFRAFQKEALVGRRFAKDEELRRGAEETIERFERHLPVPARKLQGQEAFEEIWKSHRPASPSIPEPSRAVSVILPPYTTGEKISFPGGDYVVHGNIPVSVMTMTIPPAPVNADMTRYVVNSGFDFPFTVISEYVITDEEKSKHYLDYRIWWRNQMEKLGQKSPEARKVTTALERVRESLAVGERIVKMRYFIVVYGPSMDEVGEEAALECLKARREGVAELFRFFRNGIETHVERGDSLQFLYPGLLVGESTTRKTHREISERTALMGLVPLESSWQGDRNGHTLLRTSNGRPFRLNLFNAERSNSRFAAVFGATGSGKSYLLGTVVEDFLATYPNAKVVICDFGSVRGFVTSLSGAVVDFDNEVINPFEYEGLTEGLDPTDVHLDLVALDICNLAQINAASDSLCYGLVREVVGRTYRNPISINKAGPLKTIPTLSHFLASLNRYEPEETIKPVKADLEMRLNRFKGHRTLDAPTSPAMKNLPRLACFNLGSLAGKDPIVGRAMAFRISAFMNNFLYSRGDEGIKHPKMAIWDEGTRIKNEFPEVFAACNAAGRGGRTENCVGVFCSQSYGDLQEIKALIENCGTLIVGLQTREDQLAEFKNDYGLSGRTVDAIRSIQNNPFECHQFVILQGDAGRRVAEKVDVSVSPFRHWRITSGPEDLTAKRIVKGLMPEASELERCYALSTTFSHGLDAERKRANEIDWEKIFNL